MNCTIEHLTGAMADARLCRFKRQMTATRANMAFRDLGIRKHKTPPTASEARENYNQALQIDPHDPFALMGMGLLAYRDTDFRTAAEFFSRAAAVEPIDFHYLLMATALQKGGRQAEANTAYAQARRVSSDWADAQKKADWFLSN